MFIQLVTRWMARTTGLGKALGRLSSLLLGISSGCTGITSCTTGVLLGTIEIHFGSTFAWLCGTCGKRPALLCETFTMTYLFLPSTKSWISKRGCRKFGKFGADLLSTFDRMLFVVIKLPRSVDVLKCRSDEAVIVLGVMKARRQSGRHAHNRTHADGETHNACNA